MGINLMDDSMQSNAAKNLLVILRAMCDAVERNQDYLCELDGALGDGDHGISMTKSFRAVRNSLPSLEAMPVSEILTSTGMTLIAEVGGAMGPLFGTAFLRAGKSTKGKEELSGADIAEMLAAAEEGIVQRGKAQPGDKTMVDALHPAVVAAQESAARGADCIQVLSEAATAASAGAESTKTMIARVGRASRLGERTLGHQDAGATSIAILLAAAAKAAQDLLREERERRAES